MTYRSSSEPVRRPPRLLRYGPFLPRASDVVVTLGVALLSVSAIAGLAITEESLVCERRDGAIRCVHRDRVFPFPAQEHHLSGDDVASIEWVPYQGNKGAAMGRTELFDRVGRPLSMFAGSRVEAREIYERVTRFFDEPSETRLAITDGPPWWAGLGGVVGLLVAAWLLRQILRRPTSVKLWLYEHERRLEIEQCWVGVGLQRESVSLDDVCEITIERGLVAGLTSSRSDRGDAAGRIVLCSSDGDHAVTEPLLRGTDVHDRAANALRREVGLPTEESLLFAAAPRVTARASRVRRFVPVVLGVVAIVATVGITLVMDSVESRDSGRLEIECDHRCRFDGVDCRPGGSVADSRAPGAYDIEVFDPDAPGGWRIETVTVRRGETTTFHCR